MTSRHLVLVDDAKSGFWEVEDWLADLGRTLSEQHGISLDYSKARRFVSFKPGTETESVVRAVESGRDAVLVTDVQFGSDPHGGLTLARNVVGKVEGAIAILYSQEAPFTENPRILSVNTAEYATNREAIEEVADLVADRHGVASKLALRNTVELIYRMADTIVGVVTTPPKAGQLASLLAEPIQSASVDQRPATLFSPALAGRRGFRRMEIRMKNLMAARSLARAVEIFWSPQECLDGMFRWKSGAPDADAFRLLLMLQDGPAIPMLRAQLPTPVPLRARFNLARLGVLRGEVYKNGEVDEIRLLDAARRHAVLVLQQAPALLYELL